MWKQQGFVEFAGTKPAQMMACLSVLERKYGGARGYLSKVLGYSEKDLGTMRRNLLV